MNTPINLWLVILGMLHCCYPEGIAQNLHFTLPDSVEVTLSPKIENGIKLYYYWPTNFSIATKEDGTEEFSFLTWKEDDKGEVKGGILHMLLTWGLNQKQSTEIEQSIAKIDSTAILMGAIPVEAGNPVFEINTEHELGQILKRSLKSSGGVPLYPGDKLALSFMFSAEDAQRLLEMLKQNDNLFRKTLFQLNLLPITGNRTIKSTYSLRFYATEKVIKQFKQSH